MSSMTSVCNAMTVLPFVKLEQIHLGRSKTVKGRVESGQEVGTNNDPTETRRGDARSFGMEETSNVA
jgi:hypothetical protein